MPKFTKYHVIVVNIKTGEKVYMTQSPVTHNEACSILSKTTKYPWRLEKLEEVTVSINCLNECIPKCKCAYDGGSLPCQRGDLGVAK